MASNLSIEAIPVKWDQWNCDGLDVEIGHSGPKLSVSFSMSTIAAKTANASLSLLTDLYQLTMACAYWKSGTADKMAAFHLSFRKPPFDSGFTIGCGLASAIEFLRDLRFEPSDLAYLATVVGRDN